MCQLAEFFGCL